MANIDKELRAILAAVHGKEVDVYKRQGYDSLCCKRDYSSNGKT